MMRMMFVTRLREKVVLFPVSDPNNKLTFVFFIALQVTYGVQVPRLTDQNFFLFDQSLQKPPK